jgi:hypothetical protein
MTINETLLEAIKRAAQSAAAKQSTGGDIAGLWKRLGTIQDQADMPDRLAGAKSRHWAGAVPMHEPANAVFDLPAGAAALETVGVDGSQVRPDYDAPVVWAYTHAVAVRKNDPRRLRQQRFFDEEYLVGDYGRIPDALIDVQRTLCEMTVVAEAARLWPEALVLQDGALLPWMGVAGRSFHDEVAEHLVAYLQELASCQGRPVASVISSPRSRLLPNLVRLADATSLDDIWSSGTGVMDGHLMRYALEPGQRSAVFLHGSPRNDLFAAHDAAICFFFLRVNDAEIVRVEVPAWVGESAEQLDAVHAAVYADSVVTAAGYSYILARAHEEAVIRGPMVAHLRGVALRAYLESGGRIGLPSAKQQFKESG